MDNLEELYLAQVAVNDMFPAETREFAAKKLYRRDDPETSREAAEKMVKSGELNRQENEVLSIIKIAVGESKDYFNFTTKEIARKMLKYPYYQAYDICRKRFSSLRDKDKIEQTGKQREGCRVWRLL